MTSLKLEPSPEPPSPKEALFRTPEAELIARAKEARDAGAEFGSLDAFFKDRVARYAYPLSFLQPNFSSVKAWRQEALTALEEAMRRPREVCIRSTALRNLIRSETSVREEWIIETSAGQTIPATVLRPPGEGGKHPAIIALHDMSGMRLFGREKLFRSPDESRSLSEARQMSYEGVPLAEALVKHGFLVVAIDALGFGERVADWKLPEGDLLARRSKLSPEQARKATFQIIEKEYAAVRGAFLANTTWAGLIAQDDLLTLNFLRSRSDIDPQRIGCIGFSFGAYRAHYLAALSPLVKATVSICWHSTLAGIAGYNISGAMGAFTLLPGLHEKMDLCDLAALICPRSLLAISAWNDLLMQPFGAVQAHLKLRAVWQKAGEASRLGSLFFDTGHQCNRAMQQKAFEWLDRELA